MQLTDDSIDNIVYKIMNKLDDIPTLSVISDKDYESISEFIEETLKPFSNGYRNHN